MSDAEKIAKLRDALSACALSLQEEIQARYMLPIHPSQQRRHDRDMAEVLEARKLLRLTAP